MTQRCYHFWHKYKKQLQCRSYIVYGTILIHTYNIFFISVDRLMTVNYSMLLSVESPGIRVSLNPLCTGPLSQIFVLVLFGIQRLGEDNCIFMDSDAVKFGGDRDVFIPLDGNKVVLPTNQMGDYEYCARASLNGEELFQGYTLPN